MVHDHWRRSAALASPPINTKLDRRFHSPAALYCLEEEYSSASSLGLPGGYGTLPGPYTPTPPHLRENGTLERRRGAWRDAGFWLRIISPGGTKRLQRRGGPNADLPLKSDTLPRNIKYSAVSPMKPTTPVSSFSRTVPSSPFASTLGRTTPVSPFMCSSKSFTSPILKWNRKRSTTTPFRNLDFGCEPGYCSGVWDGSPQTPTIITPPGSFRRHDPRSRTLPRDLRCASPQGSHYSGRSVTPTWGSGRGSKSPGGSPWWWRVISPSFVARKIFPERRHSPRSPADVVIEWVGYLHAFWVSQCGSET